MSGFIAKKLDINYLESYYLSMPTAAKSAVGSRHVTRLVRQRVERAGERLWRLEDFRDLPFLAVAQALSRLKRDGALDRLSKGVYYRNRQTAFGKSLPNPTAIRNLASQAQDRFPVRHCRRPPPGIHNSDGETR